MSAWEAMLLGLLQGATEFLPVSSSGHLVVGQTLLGLRLPGVSFEVAVHFATLLSIVLVYRRKLWELARGAVAGDGDAWRYIGLLAVATLPAVVVGLFFRGPFIALYDQPRVVALAFMVTGGLLWSTRTALRKGGDGTLGLGGALLVGVAQALAITPGISRSGATVVTALWLGVRPTKAAEFAFLMAIPAIAGASVLELPELLNGETGISAAALLSGGVVAAVSGVAAIQIFLAFLRREAFHQFALYLWLLGPLFLAYAWHHGL